MPALAAAAYNAGPGRAQAWRPAAPLEGAIWVETIPFNETRDYVKKVLANAMIYDAGVQQRDHARRSPSRARRSCRRAAATGRQLGRRSHYGVADGADHAASSSWAAAASSAATSSRGSWRPGYRVDRSRRAGARTAKHLILLPTVDVVEEDIHDPQVAATRLFADATAVDQSGRHPQRDRRATRSSACTSSSPARWSPRATARACRGSCT